MFLLSIINHDYTLFLRPSTSSGAQEHEIGQTTVYTAAGILFYYVLMFKKYIRYSPSMPRHATP